MKSILYVGATLMIGASIYGFVDYRKTSHSKKFSSMYESKEAKETEPVTKEEPKKEDNKVVVVDAEKLAGAKAATTATVATYKKVTRKKLNTRLFSRGSLEEKYVNKVTIKEAPKEEKETPKVEVKEN